MHSQEMGKPDVLKREVAIINLLRERPEGMGVREIYDEVTIRLGDTISRPAYYKLLSRLVAVGKIEEVDEPGTRRYILPQQLHATNRLTLDDVYEMLPFVKSTESMARAIEAQQYFLQHRDTIIRRAAQALCNEPAVELFLRWIHHLVVAIEFDLRSYQAVEEEGPHIGKAVLADAGLEHRLRAQCDALRELLYRHLSVPRFVVDLPEWDGPHGLKETGSFNYNPDKLRDVIERRVFGVGEKRTVLGSVTVKPDALKAASQELIISGSDGSFHAGTLGIRTAQGYIEDESFVITFNNSVAYERSSERLEEQRGAKKFLHSAPVTRETLDDPTYKGMVLAPFMFPTLTEADYEHMVRAATDIVQMRVDDDIFNGRARDIATGEQIMPPRVHIRDGTITPQERYFYHYYRMDPYGDIVREGIQHTRNILQRIVTARGTPQIYAGAVKSTHIRLFSRLVNWYIGQGSKQTLGDAIEPNWDGSRAEFISDIDAMTNLFASFPDRGEKDGFRVSCVVLRQFASLTEFFDWKVDDESNWFPTLCKYRQSALDVHENFHGSLPYHALISEDDLANDSYVYLLERADYASFYVGHTGGNPAPKIPRYEFLCSLRNTPTPQAKEHVEHTIQQLVTALLTCHLTPDRDHNFLSKLSLVKMIPFVVYQAHEFAKVLGKRLESDFKSAVVKRLADRRKQRIDDRDAVVNPISVQRYLQRFSSALQGPDEIDGDR
jgi:Fe2+ or Zn2+ uptake regulation protein